MTIMDYATEIHEACTRAAADFFIDIEPGRRIMLSLDNDMADDGSCFVLHRERVEEGPPTWGVYFWRPWIGGGGRAMVPLSDAPLTARLDFIESAGRLREAYLKQIAWYEMRASARFGKASP